MDNQQEQTGKFDRLIGRLSQPRALRFVVIFLLHSSFAYESFRRYFEQKQQLLASRYRQGHHCNLHRGTKCPPNLVSAKQSRWMLTIIRYLKKYNQFSTFYLIFLVARKLLPWGTLIDFIFKPSIPANCYIPGRQVLCADLLEGGQVIVIVLINLGYRLMRLRAQKSLRLDTLGFLLFSSEQVERQSRRIENQIDENQLVDGSCKDLHARQLRSLMRLPVEVSQPNKLLQTIRPNRTPQVHMYLRRELISATLLAVLIAVPLLSLIGFWNLFRLLKGREYLARYPGCNPSLERLALSSQVSDWSLNLSWHRLYSFPLDLADSLLVWLDMMRLFIFASPMCFVLNEDLLIYCRQLPVALQILQRCLHQTKETETALPVPTSIQQQSNSLQVHSSSLRSPKTRAEERTETSRELQELDVSDRNSANKQIQILGCQAKHLVRDFFDQLEAIDEFISDYITVFVIAWLCSTASAVYYTSSSGKNVDPLVVSYRILSFMIFTKVSELLFRVHKTSRASYNLICSVMANERTRQRKNFRRLLEFYTNRKRATYTLFHQRPYLASEYLTIVGLTLSIVTVMLDLVNQIGGGNGQGGQKELVCHWVLTES